MTIIETLNKAIEEDPRLNYLLGEDINPDHEDAAIKVLRHRLSQVAHVENQLRKNKHRLDNELLEKLIQHQEMARSIEKIIRYIETDEFYENEYEKDED
jgi:hypothetical protein|tara:strand:+ start:1707 stop:2003 length:297 start_codon:yes stop_codon:yes gene_type:complete